MAFFGTAIVKSRVIHYHSRWLFWLIIVAGQGGRIGPLGTLTVSAIWLLLPQQKGHFQRDNAGRMLYSPYGIHPTVLLVHSSRERSIWVCDKIDRHGVWVFCLTVILNQAGLVSLFTVTSFGVLWLGIPLLVRFGLKKVSRNLSSTPTNVKDESGGRLQVALPAVAAAGLSGGYVLLDDWPMAIVMVAASGCSIIFGSIIRRANGPQ